MNRLSRDPFSVIITGVGGQGNVMASRVLAGMMARQGFHVTIGETFGASQRGGSVMSHLRISEAGQWSPQIPRGLADVIISLEPIEVARVLKDYGNPEVQVLSNTYPIHPVNVISGAREYPRLDDIRTSVSELCGNVRFIDATDEGLALGHHILGNIIMLGALSALGVLPMERDDFAAVMRERIAEKRMAMNMAAYERGAELLRAAAA